MENGNGDVIFGFLLGAGFTYLAIDILNSGPGPRLVPSIFSFDADSYSSTSRPLYEPKNSNEDPEGLRRTNVNVEDKKSSILDWLTPEVWKRGSTTPKGSAGVEGLIENSYGQVTINIYTNADATSTENPPRIDTRIASVDDDNNKTTKKPSETGINDLDNRIASIDDNEIDKKFSWLGMELDLKKSSIFCFLKCIPGASELVEKILGLRQQIADRHCEEEKELLDETFHELQQVLQRKATEAKTLGKKELEADEKPDEEKKPDEKRKPDEKKKPESEEKKKKPEPEKKKPSLSGSWWA